MNLNYLLNNPLVIGVEIHIGINWDPLGTVDFLVGLKLEECRC